MTPIPTVNHAKTDEPVRSLEEVKQALIRIQTDGDFQYPEENLLSQKQGVGTGFIIDPTGIAITDANSVAGADSITVLISGDQSQAFQAEILKVSECKDLAILRILGKQKFPFLKWAQSEVVAGTNIFLASLQGSENLFSLVKGVIINQADIGSSSLGYQDAALEYEAVAEGETNGSPLINLQGEVVGIHQSSITRIRRSYGLPSEVIKDFLDESQNHIRISELGINGEAVDSELNGYFGIWVSAVQKGSLASETGIQGGDLIIKIGGKDLSQDRWMQSYCQVVQDEAMNSFLSIELIRTRTNKIMAGEISQGAVQVTGDWIHKEPVTRRVVGKTIVDPNTSEPGDYFIFSEFSQADDSYSFLLPEGESFKTAVSNNVLYLEVDQSNSTLYAYYPEKLQSPDVEVSTLVRTVAGPNRNNVSLICRASELGWYEFSMNSGGYWFIWRYEDGDYIKLASGGSKVINLQKAENELSVLCQGDQLSLTINDSLVGAITNDRFSEGGEVGVSVSTFEIPGAGVEFYWFAAAVP